MNPTPEQVAALTEALEASGYPRGITARDMAAAILATLPDDWCGHIGVEEAIAQGQRMLAERDATIARLRKIEEAAKALVALWESFNFPAQGTFVPTFAALRAALAGKAP
jgi:hypothetical protein